jgi:hypothetical protein
MGNGKVDTPILSTAPSLTEYPADSLGAKATQLQESVLIAARLGSIAQVVRTVFEHWKSVTHHPRSQLDEKRAILIRARLNDGYTEDDLKLAAFGCAHSRWHQGENDRHQVYDSVELIYRNADKVDQFMRLGEQEQFRRERAIQSEREEAQRRIAASTVGDKYQAARGKLLSIVRKA